MKKLTLFTFLIIILSCSENTGDEIGPIDISDEITLLVNEYRTTLGLNELSGDDACSREAKRHSQNMADKTVAFSHDGFEDRFDLLKNEIGARSMAENVARGQATAEEVMQSWLNSEGHRNNIEGDYTHIGVGVVNDSQGQNYFTQIFVKR